jgi:predicted RNase H-like HicB family nuclease
MKIDSLISLISLLLGVAVLIVSLCHARKKKLSDSYCFPAIFYHEDTGGYSVIFPDLDGYGGNTQGEDFEDAFKSAKEVLEMVLYWIEKENQSIPKPTMANKIKVDKNAFVVMIEVYMPTIRKQKDRF